MDVQEFTASVTTTVFETTSTANSKHSEIWISVALCLLVSLLLLLILASLFRKMSNYENISPNGSRVGSDDSEDDESL